MGFIYSKPLSIEGVFAKFDTDGNGKISKEEAKATKNTDVFTDFKVKKGWTLEKFESENRDVYAQYENCATEAYNQQEKKVQKWLKQERMALSEHQECELTELDKSEQELEKEKTELENKLKLQNDAQKFGIKISPEKLSKLSFTTLYELFSIATTFEEENIRRYLEQP